MFSKIQFLKINLDILVYIFTFPLLMLEMGKTKMIDVYFFNTRKN